MQKLPLPERCFGCVAGIAGGAPLGQAFGKISHKSPAWTSLAIREGRAYILPSLYIMNQQVRKGRGCPAPRMASLLLRPAIMKILLLRNARAVAVAGRFPALGVTIRGSGRRALAVGRRWQTRRGYSPRHRAGADAGLGQGQWPRYAVPAHPGNRLSFKTKPLRLPQPHGLPRMTTFMPPLLHFSMACFSAFL